MMIRRFALSAAFFGLVMGTMGMAPGRADAGFVFGTQALADTGSPALVGGTDINIATAFSFGSLVTTSARTGGFTAGAAGLTLASTEFDPADPGTFTMGSTAFGIFTATSDMLSSSTATTQSYLITGFFTPGGEFGGGPPELATLSVSFTQAGGPGTAVSASATLSTLAVPEPSSLALCGFAGAAGLGVAGVRRRRPA